MHLDDGKFCDRGSYHSNINDVVETFSYLAKNAKTFPKLLLYAHGGLNSASASAARIAAVKDTFKRNGVYPFHFMYDTGLIEELKDVVFRRSEDGIARAGGFTDYTDIVVEKMVGRIGSALWKEMKQGAENAFADNIGKPSADKPAKTGTSSGDGIDVLRVIGRCLKGTGIEVHVVGHSLGSILMGHLLTRISKMVADKPESWTLPISTLSLLAPACRVDFYEQVYAPLIARKSQAKKPPKPKPGQVNSFVMYALNDAREQDDTVTMLYRKSLLYLVSNAFERPKESPLLGMQKFAKNTDLSLADDVFYAGTTRAAVTDSKSHGGFDNDVATMNHLLERILGERPKHPFTKEVLDY